MPRCWFARIDTLRPPADPNAIDESLYLNGKTARRISLGFNGLAADWYWMRSLQYVGRKIINASNDVPIDNLGQLNLKLLAPLLDTATTLDPEFLDPYEYAAIVLPPSTSTSDSHHAKRHRRKSRTRGDSITISATSTGNSTITRRRAKCTAAARRFRARRRGWRR